MVETIDSTGLHCQAFSPSPAASSCGFAVLQDPLFNTCTQGCSEGPVSYCGGGGTFGTVPGIFRAPEGRIHI